LILDGLEPLQNPPGAQEGRLREPSLQARTSNGTIHNEYRNQVLTIQNGRDASVLEF
jgi:hypothetical protein